MIFPCHTNKIPGGRRNRPLVVTGGGGAPASIQGAVAATLAGASVAATGTVSAINRLVIIAGQSNAIGTGTPADASTPYPAVQMYDHNAPLGDPISWQDETWRDLQGRSGGFGAFPVGSAGVEISMGRALDAAGGSAWHIAKMAIDGSGLENNWVNAGYPTTPPSLLDQFKSFITARLADKSATLAAVVWIQGENDATESPDAANYLTNLGTLSAALRAEFGEGFLFLIHRLSSNYGGIASARIRSAQESFAVGKANVRVTHGDDLAFSDTAHYTGASLTTLGERMADEILGHLSSTPKTDPYWKAAGVPVEATSTGGVTAAWPTHEAGDIGVLILAGIGNTNYATPAGWTAFPDSPQHDGASGLNARVHAWWRRADSAAMADVTVADVSGDDTKIGMIVTVGGCASTGDPFDVTAGATAASGTAVSMPGDTTTVANALVMHILGHEADASVAQASGWANADLTDLTEQVDVATVAGVGPGIVVVTGRKAAAGAFGATTATLATATTQAKLTIAFKA